MPPTRVKARAALVLAIGLDDLTLSLLHTAVHGTELSVYAIRADNALEHVRTEQRPILALVEWAPDQEARQARLSAAIKQAARSGSCSVVALGAGGDPSLARALGHADDVLSRPFGDPQIVLLRLRHALRLLLSPLPSISPREALEEAVHGEQSGEVVVRSGEVVGHIHMQRGHIVWANLSAAPATIPEIVAHAAVTLSAEVVSEVREEAYATRAHFMDVIVARGLLTFDEATSALRTFIGSRVEQVMNLPEPSALFLPRPSPDTDHVRLRVDEIPALRGNTSPPEGEPMRLSLPPPSLPAGSAEIRDLVEQAMAIDGARSVAVLDRRTGASLFVSGADIDTSIAWSQLAALGALGPDAEDVIGSEGERCFVTRALTASPSVALFVVLRRADITIGLARALVAKVAATHSGRTYT